MPKQENKKGKEAEKEIENLCQRFKKQGKK